MLTKTMISKITLLLLLISLTLIFTPILSAEDEVINNVDQVKDAISNNNNPVKDLEPEIKKIETGSGLTILVDPLIVYGKME